uniref:CA domain-containing protein n=1 Tax=Macrostomum lignano TaxID=282301 RepID=A0A1I8FCJ8_9PLAT
WPSPQAAVVGATAGYSLLEAKAIDSDLHDNGRVSYSLIDATNSGLQIDSSSGTLYVIKSVTRLGEGQPEQFPLTIQARDHGNPSSLSSTVRVWVRIVDSSEYPAASGGPDDAAGGSSGGRNAGKDSYTASHRMRATVVIGLIVFFSSCCWSWRPPLHWSSCGPAAAADARCSSKAASPTVEEVAAILSAASAAASARRSTMARKPVDWRWAHFVAENQLELTLQRQAAVGNDDGPNGSQNRPPEQTPAPPPQRRKLLRRGEADGGNCRIIDRNRMGLSFLLHRRGSAAVLMTPSQESTASRSETAGQQQQSRPTFDPGRGLPFSSN